MSGSQPSNIDRKAENADRIPNIFQEIMRIKGIASSYLHQTTPIAPTLLYTSEDGLNQSVNGILIVGIRLLSQSVGYNHATGDSLMTHECSQASQR